MVNWYALAAGVLHGTTCTSTQPVSYTSLVTCYDALLFPAVRFTACLCGRQVNVVSIPRPATSIGTPGHHRRVFRGRNLIHSSLRMYHTVSIATVIRHDAVSRSCQCEPSETSVR
jgi:hypothetical protein